MSVICFVKPDWSVLPRFSQSIVCQIGLDSFDPLEKLGGSIRVDGSLPISGNLFTAF